MSSGSVVPWESDTTQSPQPRANTPTAGRPKSTVGQAQAVQGHKYFKGVQYNIISLSDPQYFSRGTTYFGPNLKYMVRGDTSGGTKYSVTRPAM